MKKNVINQQGFTLVELLVVVAIIGMLASLSIVALGSARTKARDAARVASVKNIQTALELYYSDTGLYPSTVTPGSPLVTSSVTYLNSVPKNQTPWTGGTCTAATAKEFVYTGSSTAGNYKVTFCLEGGSGGLVAGWHTATPAGIR
jgi:prepilin-type N-terminal cleavage/methylation domain-containing protein